jgi:hypothetical protein
MIEPVAEQPGFFRVCLGRGTYLVSAETGQCSCPAWEFRCSKVAGSLCKHGTAVAEYIAEQKRCDVCQGRGVFVPRCAYPQMTGIECAACDGSGLKQTVDSLSDADLRRLFA